jgi:hypothetical protein
VFVVCDRALLAILVIESSRVWIHGDFFITGKCIVCAVYIAKDIDDLVNCRWLFNIMRVLAMMLLSFIMQQKK